MFVKKMSKLSRIKFFFFLAEDRFEYKTFFCCLDPSFCCNFPSPLIPPIMKICVEREEECGLYIPHIYDTQYSYNSCQALRAAFNQGNEI